MSSESDDFQVLNFVEEWLNHMNIITETNLEVKSVKARLNFFLPATGTGIYISEWKKPFSVQSLNNALRLFDELNLSEMIIITKQISEHALDTIKRIKVNVSIIHPFSLSELAMKFVSVSKFENLIAI